MRYVVITRYLNQLTICCEIKDSNGVLKEKYQIRNGKTSPATQSTSLEMIKNSTLSNSNNLICLDNPEIFLTNEIKSDTLDSINQVKKFQEQWVELKTKYAYMLLNKGNI